MSPRLILTVGGALCGASSFAFASSTLVYMNEVDSSKQIYAIDENGNNPRPLTKGSDWHLYPDISADGKWLTYIAGPDEGSLSVYTKNLSTGATEQWDFGVVGTFLHPDLSADGKLLAVSGPFGANGLTQIAIVNLERERQAGPSATRVDGGTLVSIYKTKPQVLKSEFSAYFPAFSTDNSFVVFQQTESPTQKTILKYDLASNTSGVLSEGFSVAMSPALSFDDGMLAFTASVDGNWDVYVKNLQTMAVSRVTTDAANDFAPTFLPDGALVFANNALGNFHLYKLQKTELLTGIAIPTLLTLNAGDDYAPSASGDLLLQQQLLASMPEPARSSFGAVVNGKKVYVAGGHKGHEHTYPPESFMNALEVYDVSRNTWQSLASRSVAAHGFGLASYGKYVYAFGGFAYSAAHSPSWKSLDVIERYDTENNKWEVVGKLPRPRSSNVVAQVGSKVYLMGGWDSTPKFPNDLEGTFLRAIDMVDLETLQVSTLTTELPNPLRRALTGVVIGNEIYLLGGLGQGASHFELLDNVTSFNVTTGRWTEHQKLPFATFAPAAGALDHKIYIFGGMFKAGDMEYNYVNHIFSLDLNRPTEKWEHTGRYLSEPKGFPQVVNSPLARSLLVFGGHRYWPDGNDSPVLTAEEFLLSN